MDPQSQRGRSPSAGHHQPQIQSHSPSPAGFQTLGGDPSADLGLALDNQQQQQHHHQQQQQYAIGNDPSLDAFGNNQQFFDPNADFTQQMSSAVPPDPSVSFPPQPQGDYLSPNLNDGDFSLFPPPTGHSDQYNAPLFEQSSLSPNDISSAASPQAHSSPTPPHLFADNTQQHPGSAHQSPSFAHQAQFPSPSLGGHHSRNASHTSHASLGPEAALLPNQLADWTQQPQFQGHRRSPSAHSDVSSVSPSPNLIASDSFDDSSHSPLQRASDGSVYQDVLGIGSFSISDPNVGSPANPGRSPSHSPAISPRINPQQMPEMGGQATYGLAPPGMGYVDPSAGYPTYQVQNEAFPTLQTPSGNDMSQMAPPSINIDYAPTNRVGGYEGSKEIDQASLTPPERGE